MDAAIFTAANLMASRPRLTTAGLIAWCLVTEVAVGPAFSELRADNSSNYQQAFEQPEPGRLP